MFFVMYFIHLHSIFQLCLILHRFWEGNVLQLMLTTLDFCFLNTGTRSELKCWSDYHRNETQKLRTTSQEVFSRVIVSHNTLIVYILFFRVVYFMWSFLLSTIQYNTIKSILLLSGKFTYSKLQAIMFKEQT